jgi:hypothetical protein
MDRLLWQLGGRPMNPLESTVELQIDIDPDYEGSLLINAKPGDNEQIFVQERTTLNEDTTEWIHRSEIRTMSVEEGSRIVAFTVDLRAEKSKELARYKVTDDLELKETDYSFTMQADYTGNSGSSDE